MILSYSIYAQITISSASVDAFSTAGQGDLYVDENSAYYIGLEDGSLKEIGIVSLKGSNNNEVLSWNATQDKWEPRAQLAGGLTISKVFIPNRKRARFIIAPMVNINASQTTSLTYSGVSFNETTGLAAGNNISGLAGNLRFIIHINLDALSTQRVNFNLSMRVNGVLNKKVYGSLYARGISDHNNTGAQFLFDYESALSTDTFRFDLEGEANSGNVNIISTTTSPSFVSIEQYDTIEILTDASAPTDLSLAEGPQGPEGVQGPQGPQGNDIQQPTDVYHATGNVRSNGNANYIQGATVTRTSTGRYSVTFTQPHSNGLHYPVLFSMEQNNGEDDYIPTYLNTSANGFDIEITEQDNGGSAGTFVNAGFSFYVPL